VSRIQPNPEDPARSNGETAPTVHTRMIRPSESRLNLQGQHEYLQQDDSGQQDQRFVTRGNGYHVDSETRNFDCRKSEFGFIAT